MRDAEDVAREALGRNVMQDGRPGTIGRSFADDEVARVADLIRARDAEVRAETLTGFGVETDDDCFCAVACDATIHVRLVGPWEPDNRTPEQRSIDAINRLRPLLTEPEDR